MLIMRAVNWYRPYYITASGRGYKVERIHFYKDDKILVSTCGWLEKEKYGDITSLELPIDEIKVRRKEKFDGSVFAISKGKEDYSTDLLAELYIPAEMLDVHFEKNVIKYKTKIYAIYRGANDIYISTYVKSLDDKLNELREEYEKIYKDCDGYNLGYHTENIIENLESLKKLAEQYIKEYEQVTSLNIDDIDL